MPEAITSVVVHQSSLQDLNWRRLHGIADHSYQINAEALSFHERRGPLTMSLLWITMVTSFPSLLIGFDWYRQGASFLNVVFGVLLGCTIVLAYYIPICFVSAKTGLSFKFLS